MSQIIDRTKKFLGKEEEGATMVEYALMIFLIAVISIGIIGILGGQVQAAFAAVSAAF